MKINTLTDEINSRLKIKSTKGFKFGNSKVQFSTSGLGLYHDVLGFISFDKDSYGVAIPYIPQGGRRVLKDILNDGGLTSYSNMQFAKPIWRD